MEEESLILNIRINIAGCEDTACSERSPEKVDATEGNQAEIAETAKNTNRAVKILKTFKE